MSLPKIMALAIITIVALAGVSRSLSFDGERHAEFAGLRQYDSIAATGPDDIVISQGRGFSVRAEGPRDAVDRLRIEVVDGQLRIGRRENGGFLSSFRWGWGGGGSGGATVRVTMPSVRAVSMAGSGDVRLGSMTGERLQLSLRGSGDMSAGTLKVAALDTELIGSGDISVSGEAGTARLSLRGSGDIGAARLKAGNVDISLLGSGDISVASDGKAMISGSGSGDIDVIGRPQCTLARTGSGDITCG